MNQVNQYKRTLRSKEDEGKLATGLRELIPGIEKEEQVSCASRIASVASADAGSEYRGLKSAWQLLPNCRKWPNGEVHAQDGRPEKSITRTTVWAMTMPMAM